MIESIAVWRGRTGLYIISFLMDMCVGCASLGVVLYADDLGASAFKLGIVGATAFAYSIACLFTGRLSDAWGRKRVAGFGALIYAGVYLYLAVTRVDTVPHLMVLAVIGAAGVGFFWPPIQAWLGEQRDKRSLSSSLGIFNVCWSIGLVLGPVATTWLRKLGPLAPFYFASATTAVIMVLMLLIKRDGRTPEEVEPLAVAPRVAATFLYMAWIANFASWFMSNSVKTLLPKLTRAWLVPDTTLGWLVATIAIAQTIMFASIRFSKGWQYRLTPLVLFLGIGAAGMVIVAVGDSPALWAAGVAMAGLCAGMTYTASLFYTLHGRSAGQGARTGFHEAILGSGILLGPLLGGAAIDATGGNLYVPYILAAAVTCAALIAVIVVFVVRRGADAQAAEHLEPQRTTGE